MELGHCMTMGDDVIIGTRCCVPHVGTSVTFCEQYQRERYQLERYACSKFFQSLFIINVASRYEVPSM